MVRFSTDHPRLVTALTVLATVVLGAFIATIDVNEDIDTDPENMLSKDDPVRVAHDRLKEEFNIYDMIVLGVVNEEHPEGVFYPEALARIHALTAYGKSLRGDKLKDPFDPADIDAIVARQEPQATDGTQEKPETSDADAPQMPEGPGGGAPALPETDSAEGPALPDMEGSDGPPLPRADEDDGPPLPGMGPEPAEAPEPLTEDVEPDLVGVVPLEVLSLSTVDRIEHNRQTGSVEFNRLMPVPPRTQEQADAVLRGALSNPLLRGTVAGADSDRKPGQAAAIYLPITQKDISYKVSQRIQAAAEHLGGPEQYHVTGLPVAEDTFGHEMFVQMAISAPLAMLVIFILLLVFFRKIVLIISPMIVAVVSVIVTMGLLIGLGYTVHIMSSMIPIFIMPIAVLDAIHILSEFFDRDQATRDREATVHAVMEELFTPMLYTSLTSAAGFASLALTPIPPVQVFGVFVAFGIMVAWLLTVTFIPSYIMFIPENRLEGFGVSHADEAPDTFLTRLLRRLGHFTRRHGKFILTATGIVLAVAVWGISRININDNPTKWFTHSHPIRVADRALNDHFAGTYQAYLSLTPSGKQAETQPVQEAMLEALQRKQEAQEALYSGEEEADVRTEIRTVYEQARETIRNLEPPADRTLEGRRAFFDRALAALRPESDGSLTWDDAISTVQAVRDRLTEYFKQPERLRVIDELQETLPEVRNANGRQIVGKSNSLADIVKKVNLELHGEDRYNRIPNSYEAVGQTILQFQNSNRPTDLLHFTTPPRYDQANVWLQLRSGDNKDMERVIAAVDEFMADHPEMEHEWFGLTYINVKWQDKMVTGMLQAFLGSFLVVFILMTVLFGSALWGLLCMIPLTVTIGLIYGIIGIVGKDYDMPVAVLSSLTLGLAVDFAIHFLARTRSLVSEHGSWREALEHIFGEPARAISRNAIVVAVGFLPLLAAPLVPYKTVGFFMAGILSVAAVGTLIILPAMITALQRKLFREESPSRVTCNCVAAIVSSVAVVVLLALSYQSYFDAGWNQAAIICAVGIPLVVLVTAAICRRRACRRADQEETQSPPEE